MQGKENSQKETDPVLTTKVHGYKQIIVSNLLKDRHPYIDKNSLALQFDSRKSNQLNEIVPKEKQTEVFKGVWFRTISNVVKILTDQNSSPETLQESLLVLNEIVSVQEQKIVMIDSGLVEIVFGILTCENNKVRIECLS